MKTTPQPHPYYSDVELSPQELNQQAKGWSSLIFFLFFFPALFFLCVYFPIWVGWIQRFP